MPADYQDVALALAGSGLVLRGGFAVGPEEGVPPVLSGDPAKYLLLIGNAGGSMWPAFSAGCRAEAEPLDAWTKRVVDPVAGKFGARVVYPNDRPYQPFQAWAKRAEPVHPSPLGILIHPEYGLWHAYRAALIFADAISAIPARRAAASPCETCLERPCLRACPVEAFDGQGFDVPACAGHLRSGQDPACASLGCRARDACPVGREHRYPQAQVDFHMAAFIRSRGGPWPTPR